MRSHRSSTSSRVTRTGMQHRERARDMRKKSNDHAFMREKALGDGLKEVASELRLVDVVDLVTYIRNEQFANVGDLVSSSVERFFKPDTLRYGSAGDVDLNWGTQPSV